MVDIAYDDDWRGAESVGIPLGATRRTVLIIIGTLLTTTCYVSTYLFQQISKRDNNLRQRGRYLVTLQGYFSTFFLSVICFYQAYKYRFPCVVLYYGSYLGLIPFVLLFTGRAWRLITRFDRNKAIYQSRFAEPSELDPPRMSLAQPPIAALVSKSHLDRSSSSSPANVLDQSLLNLATLQAQQSLGFDQQHHKVIEVTQEGAKELALSKRWYNRYRSVTDRQMLSVAILYMTISITIALYYQFNVSEISVNPLSYKCRSASEYYFPYATTIFFLYVVSPIMIYQLKGINDGFGIRRELIFLSVFSAPCFVLYFVLPEFAPEFSKEIMDRTTFMALILIASIISSIIVPLTRHFKASPHQCQYTAAFRRKRAMQHKGTEVSTSFGKDSQEGGSSAFDAGQAEWISTDDIPMEQSLAKEDLFHSGHMQYLTSADSTLPGLQSHSFNSADIPAEQDQQTPKSSSGNIGLGLKSITRHQQRQPVAVGTSHNPDMRIGSIKADWVEFLRALEDRVMFDRMSAFTVGEFCAENTRFLYEVTRLEKRAAQYEHLRNLTTTALDAGHAQGPTHSSNQPISTADNLASRSGQFPHRVKKIVSTSSVSSTMPMLGPRRSNSSLFDDSEPPSPIGSSSHSTFKRYGPSTLALPDLEEGLVHEESETSAGISHSCPVSVAYRNAPIAPLPMPPTLLIQFEYIYKTFISHGGRLELNLSYDTASEIHQKARRAEWRSGIFDSAIYEVRELLFRDVWPKFVTSSQGLNINASTMATNARRFQALADATRPAASNSTDQISDPLTYGDPLPLSPVWKTTTLTASGPSTTPKSSLSLATSAKALRPLKESLAGSSSRSKRESYESSKTQGGRKEDVFQEEPSRTGFRTWLIKKNRSGIQAATLISRQGPTEESLGIIEQSRQSMVNRRSDVSGLYSASIQNSLAGNPLS